ncbi:hypothetical protein [Paenibacillus abyssi]|uniref:Uncharacterized protein n=1 Tax=Paenibacillus abyssi TaxID=1340531 RepID=A0A917D1S3_9BACL|nr:hypothetical protein [Paenibacillus abyssi]GGG07592.1 hypothetical protein GCM10010916_25580 [Paenibacillus abyssi]
MTVANMQCETVNAGGETCEHLLTGRQNVDYILYEVSNLKSVRMCKPCFNRKLTELLGESAFMDSEAIHSAFAARLA